MSGKRRILIYRLGSLGDTAAMLPGFHLIARAFPDAERVLLTNIHGNGKASTIESILEGTDLVHGSIAYPRGGGNAWTASARDWRIASGVQPEKRMRYPAIGSAP